MAIRFNPRGDRRESLAHLNWRVRLFSVGAGLALGGTILDLPPHLWAAMALLAVGLVLRYLTVTQEDGSGMEADEDSADLVSDPDPEAPLESPEDPRGTGADAPAS